MSSSQYALTALKIISMALMFLLTVITGSLPLRWQRFKKSIKLICLSGAFSGGLFLSVGVLDLLTESNDAFNKYYASNGELDRRREKFPWSNFICVTCFVFILFIEKVAFATCIGGDGHEGHHHAHIPIGLKRQSSAESDVHNRDMFVGRQEISDNSEDFLRHEMNMPLRASFDDKKGHFETHPVGENIEQKTSKLSPYILQIGIGIHAVFEGMAIGIQNQTYSCLGIALVVACHKWAEGLTLGIAFFKADVALRVSTIMITIQGLMNPLGILIGWLLSNQGDVIRGAFQAVSAGTFIYIATGEVILNEFNRKRFRFLKFTLFMFAIGFVCLLYLIEKSME